MLNIDEDKLNAIFLDLFFNHKSVCSLGIEAGKAFPSNLGQAFKELLSDHIKKTLLYGLLTDDEEIQPNQEFFQDPIIRFGARYVNGLIDVAIKVLQKEHNGILYLFDHIERVSKNHGLIFKDENQLTVQEWRDILIKCLDYDDLFNFLSTENKVREIDGRYDERALIDILLEGNQEKRVDGEMRLTVTDLGIGMLGVVFYELIKKLSNLGIKVEVNQAVDLLDMSRLSTDPNDYLVEQYLRGREGNFIHFENINFPDTRNLNCQEIREIISWREELIKKRIIVGGIDLTQETLGIKPKKSDLVTLRGVLGCIGNLEERFKLIKNALSFVNENGGIILIEGGMTLLGGQNVGSIAIKLHGNGNAEVLYVLLSRRKADETKTSYRAGQQTLLANREEESMIGRNYYGLPFSDIELLIRMIYKSIIQKE